MEDTIQIQQDTNSSMQISSDEIQETLEEQHKADQGQSEETPEQQEENGLDKTNNTQETTNVSHEEVQEVINNRKTVENDVKEMLNTNGVNFDEVANEYADNGKLSEATLEKLNSIGLPKSVVDNYIKGLESDAKAFANEVIKVAGGEDGYKQVTAFIQSKGQNEIDNFNRLISTGDLGIITTGIKGYLSDMKQMYGTTNHTILGSSTSGSNTSKGFQSRNEMVKAMSDPRYGTDKFYTKEVEQRVINSNNIFN